MGSNPRIDRFVGRIFHLGRQLYCVRCTECDEEFMMDDAAALLCSNCAAKLAAEANRELPFSTEAEQAEYALTIIEEHL